MLFLSAKKEWEVAGYMRYDERNLAEILLTWYPIYPFARNPKRIIARKRQNHLWVLWDIIRFRISVNYSARGNAQQYFLKENHMKKQHCMDVFPSTV